MMNKKTLMLAAAIVAITPLSGFAETTDFKLNDLALKGDVRLRLQQEKKNTDLGRTRNRVRFRLSGERKISEDTTIGFGLASGGTDPRSTNQTLGNSFETPDIRLDKAYVQMNVLDDLTLIGGKMKNPLWNASDLLWDSDINPEGVGFKAKLKIDNLNGFVKGGYFVLDEISSTESDPFMVAIQAGGTVPIGDDTEATAALSLYRTQNTKGKTLTNSAGTNTGANTGLTEELTALVFSSEVTMKNQFGLPMVRPFGEVVINTGPSSANKGGIFGIKAGARKVKAEGQWQATLGYRYLGQDAWIDTMPDSDSYGGATDIQGLEFILKYGLSKKSSVGLDVYNTDRINGAKNSQTIVQIDLNTKF
ncbi:MAG: hypothetical protein ACI9BD_000719 [Candidatus Marinamargulisbacteria bacterium]|jgi:hypothetical protein